MQQIANLGDLFLCLSIALLNQSLLSGPAPIPTMYLFTRVILSRAAQRPHGQKPKSEQASRIFAGTISGTHGPVGMFRTERVSTNYRNWGDGKRSIWSCGTRTYAVISWSLLLRELTRIAPKSLIFKQRIENPRVGGSIPPLGTT